MLNTFDMWHDNYIGLIFTKEIGIDITKWYQKIIGIVCQADQNNKMNRSFEKI